MSPEVILVVVLRKCFRHSERREDLAEHNNDLGKEGAEEYPRRTAFEDEKGRDKKEYRHGKLPHGAVRVKEHREEERYHAHRDKRQHRISL